MKKVIKFGFDKSIAHLGRFSNTLNLVGTEISYTPNGT